MQKNIKNNFIYNILYQIIILAFPLIITPYTSRIFGSEGIGQINFTQSIITYFVLISSFGFNFYGQREIARNGNNKEEQKNIFWEIFFTRFWITLSLALLNLLLIKLNIYGEYSILMLVLTINIISVIFDITFLFQGREEFKKILFTSGIVKIVTLISIFMFINDFNDLILYVLIQSLSLLSMYIVLWVFVKKHDFFLMKKIKLFNYNHLKYSFVLFIPTLAASLYTVFDKTLLGIITSNNNEVGYYSQAQKIIKLILVLITSLSTIMIPRNSYLYAENKKDKFDNNIEFSFNYLTFLGFPLVLGLISISDLFVPIFFGNGFDKVSMLIKIASPLVLIIGASNIIGMQILIPMKKDRKFTTAIVIGSITNLLLNIVFITLFESVGATISSIIAELIVLFIMLYYSKSIIKLKKFKFSGFKHLISSSIMFVLLYSLKLYLLPNNINLLILVTVGIIVYFSALLILKDSFTTYLILNFKTYLLRKK
ncbi:MAG: flippase [Acholeplasmataceae bacterium]